MKFLSSNKLIAFVALPLMLVVVLFFYTVKSNQPYTDLWKSSKPDLVVYMPSGSDTADAENQMLIVTPTPEGAFLAVWTQASRENSGDQRVVVSRSTDLGNTWSKPLLVDGEVEGNGHSAQYAIPIVAPDIGRIYLFYTKNRGDIGTYRQVTGVLRFRYSEDDGKRWSQPYEIDFRRTLIDSSSSSPIWWFYQAPIYLIDGSVAVGLTKVEPEVQDSESWSSDWLQRNYECWFLKFENILSEMDPNKIKIETLPLGERGLRVPNPERRGGSYCQEPTLVQLSDGSLFSVMRTMAGKIYYSVSKDEGGQWTGPRLLLYEDDGDPLLQPMAPVGLYKLEDGRFFLVFHNNDGTANGGSGPFDYLRNRRPAYYALGRETLNRKQPVSFEDPKLLVDNGGIPAGPVSRTEIATYTSFFEFRGRKYFWYPERKHFLLGKFLSF